MTPYKATALLRRFKHDEKMLGSEEQSAIDFAVAAIAETSRQDNQPICSTCGSRDIDVHHPLCSVVTATIIGLDVIVRSSDEDRRRGIADRIGNLLKKQMKV